MLTTTKDAGLRLEQEAQHRTREIGQKDAELQHLRSKLGQFDQTDAELTNMRSQVAQLQQNLVSD
jgi:hypothetical protein